MSRLRTFTRSFTSSEFRVLACQRLEECVCVSLHSLIFSHHGKPSCTTFLLQPPAPLSRGRWTKIHYLLDVLINPRPPFMGVPVAPAACPSSWTYVLYLGIRCFASAYQYIGGISLLWKEDHLLSSKDWNGMTRSSHSFEFLLLWIAFTLKGSASLDFTLKGSSQTA